MSEVHADPGGLKAELNPPPNDPAIFSADYYLRGPESGLSNYTSYKFLESLTTEYARNLKQHLGMIGSDSVHDVGCARGYLVKVLRDMGHSATGHDISEWAIQNCHPDVAGYVRNSCYFTPRSVDWVTAKDVLEHCTEKQLTELLPQIISMARKGCLFIVPLTAYWGGKYIYPADNEDKTHKVRFTIDAWMRLLMEASAQVDGDFSIHGSYHMTGLKKASVDFPFSTGFLTCKRFDRP